MKSFPQSGVTLVELLIVVSVVAILAAIAYPAYQTHMAKTRYSDAKVKLLEIMQRQRNFFTQNNTYTANLAGGGLGYDEAVSGTGTVLTDNDFYLITARTCEDDPANPPITECVRLTATPNFSGGDQTELTFNSRNEKTGPTHAW